jgi:hypothetical protein
MSGFAPAFERKNHHSGISEVTFPIFSRPADLNYALELDLLCAYFGSDKGRSSWWPGQAPYPWQPHNYTEVYGELFAARRWELKKIFECGVGSINHEVPSNMGSCGHPGASLRVWSNFFPHAEILGADIDRSTLFQEPRIRTTHVDQLDPSSIKEMWAHFNVNTDVDIMIDDGLHTYNAGTSLLIHSWQHLSPGGLYIIEDVRMEDVAAYEAFLDSWSAQVTEGATYEVRYLERRPSRIHKDDDNRLVIIRKNPS